MRVAVFDESEGETVAPLVRDEDLERFGVRALTEMLQTAGYRVIPGTPDDAWLEARAAEADPEAATAGLGPPPQRR